MDSQYARNYRQLYEHHWWWRARESLILAELRRHALHLRRGHVLDVGCGDGLFFDRLAEFGAVEGIEADPAVLDPRGSHYDCIHQQPFDADFRPGKQYDLILMLDVLEHLADPVGGLRRAVELLSDDGVLLLTVPAFNLLWTSHDDWNHHFVRYTRQSFQPLADEVELSIQRSKYFFHWTFPVKLAVRLKEMILGRSPRPAQVPPAFINRGLLALSQFEQWALGGVPLPFGSSLLVVASRAVKSNRSPSQKPSKESFEDRYFTVKSC